MSEENKSGYSTKIWLASNLIAMLAILMNRSLNLELKKMQWWSDDKTTPTITIFWQNLLAEIKPGFSTIIWFSGNFDSHDSNCVYLNLNLVGT